MIILGTNSIKDTGYNVANSVRLNGGDSAKFNIDHSGAGNRNLWTFSMWIKRSGLGAEEPLFNSRPNDNFETFCGFGANDTLVFKQKNDGSTTGEYVTNRVFRDVSAWYNLIFVYDKDNGTAGNRGRIYVNGVEETSFATENNFSDSSTWNSTNTCNIGNSQSAYFDGYMAELVFIDGQALTPTSFGEFDSDSGIWKPIDVSGLTPGTNGFHLDFEASANLGNNAFSSGSADWTETNITAVDQSIDSCTNNFCTLNSLDNFYNAATFSEGNLLIVTGSSPYTYNTATMGMSSGKWYWEGKALSVGSGNSAFGIISTVSTSTSDEAPNKTDSAMYKDSGVVRRNNGSGTSIGAVSNNDIVSFAYDADNNFIYFALNGTWQNSGDPTSGASGTGGYDPGNVPASTATGFYFPMFSDHNSGSGYSMSFNFGSPAFAISSGNTDGDGFGNFEYAVPSGYFALNTKNLAEYG